VSNAPRAESGSSGCVAVGGAAVLAVRKMLQDRRHWALVGVVGHPDPRRQSAAVRHDDTLVGELDDLAREFGDGFHRAPVPRILVLPFVAMPSRNVMSAADVS
jgi:hypothetical protein